MKHKKRFFTLLEVIIAGALGVVLLAAVTQLYYLLEKQALLAKEIRGELFHKRLLQFRLSSLFASTADVTQGGKTLFFTSQKGAPNTVGTSLVFVPDRGIDVKPEFSNLVLARLYRDENNRLCLAYWPLPDRWKEQGPPPMQREILLEDVTDLSFSFYSPPTKDELRVGKKQAITAGLAHVDPPADSWLSEWDPAFNQIPPLIKVYITHQGKEYTIAAQIPSGTKKIIYRF